MLSRLAPIFAILTLFLACSSEDSGNTNGANPGETAGTTGSAGNGTAGSGTAGTEGGAGSGTVGSDMPCAVRELLAKRCQQCHSEPTQFGAPMPLLTRAHLMAQASTGVSVGEQSLVRMKDEKKPMPQPPNEKATDAEYAALEAWVKVGMPASEEACGAGGSGAGGSGAGGSGAGGGGPVQTCTPDAVVKASVPWTIKQDVADRYVCFGGKIASTGKKRHITEVSVSIDNTAHAHHLCVYDMGSQNVPTVPEPCDAGGAAVKGGKLLYCWAPGADSNKLPPEAGFPLAADKDANILIEMHYSNIQGKPDSTDNSAATFCTTEELRQYDADVMAFGSAQFSLPPAQSTTVESTLTAQATFFSEGWIRIIRGWPHMHLLGVAQSTEVFRNDQLIGDLGSTSTYSFDNQISYPVDVTVKPGDKVVTKCVYNNSTTNTVKFGENTTAEMCYNFVTYYPRITTPGWVWAAPSYLGKTKTYATP